MKKTLRSIANQLSEDDIQEIIRIKKMGDKKVIALRKKRDKMAADLAKLDAQLAGLTGGASAETGAAPKRRRPGRPKGSTKGKTETAMAVKAVRAGAGGKIVRSGKRKSGRRGVSISAAVREVFLRAGAPLKASQVVDGLPMAGIPVPDVAKMRKRISVILASQDKHFKQVERGVYRLKD